MTRPPEWDPPGVDFSVPAVERAYVGPVAVIKGNRRPDRRYPWMPGAVSAFSAGIGRET